MWFCNNNHADNFVDAFKEYCNAIARMNKQMEEFKNKDMENEALKRVKNAQKELELAEKALSKSEIPEYVEYKGKIYLVKNEYGKNFLRCINPNYPNEDIYDLNFHKGDCFSSTKEAFDKQNEIIRVPRLKDFEIYIENNSGSKGALVQYLNVVENYLLSKDNN